MSDGVCDFFSHFIDVVYYSVQALQIRMLSPSECRLFCDFVAYFDIKVVKRHDAWLPSAVDGNRYFSSLERDKNSSNIFKAYG